MKRYVYFRNDDVNMLDEELINLTTIFVSQGIPITHAVEPANLSEDTAKWLLGFKQENPNLIEIMQHGFDHKKRDLGEFGGARSYHEQLRDISQGKQIMEQRFGNHFLNAINFPFGPYNQSTIRVVNELGFNILSSHYNCRLSRRLFYFLGHLFNLGQIMGKHVSHHMQFYPNTSVFEIDMCISFIRQYIGGYNSNQCIFQDVDSIKKQYAMFKQHTNVVGFLLHHRYHHEQQSIDLIEETIRHLKADPDVVFTNYSQLYETFVTQ